MLTDRSFAELFSPAPVAEPTERRAGPRIPLETEVTVACEGQFFAGMSGDVSEGGIFVRTCRALPIGTRVMLEFALPKGQVLARGRVRWVRRGGDGAIPGIGVSFDELSEIDRALLKGYCGGRPRFITYDEVVAAISA